jgi:hypothetical protein
MYCTNKNQILGKSRSMSMIQPRGAEVRYRRPLPHAPELPQPVVPPGSTVAEMVAAATRDRDLHHRVRVRVDGDEVRPAWWSRSRPRALSRVEITLLP